MNLDPLIGLLFGLTCGLLLWTLWPRLATRFREDEAWLVSARGRLMASRFSPRLLMVLWYGLTLMLAVLGVLILSVPWLGPLLAAVVYFLPRFVMGVLWRRRLRKIDRQVPIAVDALTNAMSAGLTTVKAIAHTSERAPEPIRTEFRIMANRYRSGVDLHSAIETARVRLNRPNFNLLAAALLVHRTNGGNVAATLNDAARAIEKLEEMRKKILAATATGRTNVRVLCVTPLFFLGMSWLMDPDGIRMMFQSPLGQALVFGALLLIVGGVHVAWKISHPDI